MLYSERQAEERRSYRPSEHKAGWTAERVDLLKKLWAEGLSASQIAGTLGGGLTRNGVVGKVHRMKLSYHGRNDPKPPRPHRKSDGSKPHRNKGQTSGPIIAQRIAARLAGPNIAGTPLPEEPEEGVDVTKLIGLEQITPHTCKFMHGDPLKADSGFCGEPTCTAADGRLLPYCERHARRAYHGLMLAGD